MRIAITLDDQGDGTSILATFIDGVPVGSQTVDTARYTLAPNSDVLLLTAASSCACLPAFSFFFFFV